MPATLTYPGVYIEEIPSGVRTITGVATSIAAFIGWAPKGPTDRAVLVLSWADYDRQFGGLDSQAPLASPSINFCQRRDWAYRAGQPQQKRRRSRWTRFCG
jgi:phage tail sheath protein FI